MKTELEFVEKMDNQNVSKIGDEWKRSGRVRPTFMKPTEQ